MSKLNFDELVKRGVESDELDYKAHQSWNSMSRIAKAKIVRHLAAFANTRGGSLVIGVGEDKSGYPGDLQGLTDEESASFDPSTVGAFIKNHIEPPIDFVVERPVVDGKRFAVFTVKPFTTLPHVCCQSVENELREGVFYIRTVDASSRPAVRAFELHQLIQRALRNQREMLGRMLRGILYENSASVSEPEQSGTVEQLRHAIDYFIRRRKPVDVKDWVLVRITVVPDGENECSLAGIGQVLKEEQFSFVLSKYFDCVPEQVRETSVGVRCLPENGSGMWQFFKNGSFLNVGYLRLADGAVLMSDIEKKVMGTILLAGAFAEKFAQEERLYSVRLAVSGKDIVRFDISGRRNYVSRANGSAAEICRSAADLVSAPDVHCARLLRKFAAGVEESL